MEKRLLFQSFYLITIVPVVLGQLVGVLDEMMLDPVDEAGDSGE